MFPLKTADVSIPTETGAFVANGDTTRQLVANQPQFKKKQYTAE